MRYKINKGFIFQKIGKQITIFDGEESILYTLNETASYIFLRIKKGSDVNDIIGFFVERYAIPMEKAVKDVESVIEEMKRRSIVRSERKKKRIVYTVPKK